MAQQKVCTRCGRREGGIPPNVQRIPTAQMVKDLLKECATEFAEIEKTLTSMDVRGRGYLSIKDLKTAEERCERLWRNNKALDIYLSVLKTMSSLPWIEFRPK